MTAWRHQRQQAAELEEARSHDQSLFDGQVFFELCVLLFPFFLKQHAHAHSHQ